MANKDAGLNVSIIGGVVTITIGVSALCTALQPAPGRLRGRAEHHGRIRLRLWRRAELNREEEDGTTPVHKMLDHARSRLWAGGGGAGRHPLRRED